MRLWHEVVTGGSHGARLAALLQRCRDGRSDMLDWGGLGVQSGLV